MLCIRCQIGNRTGPLLVIDTFCAIVDEIIAWMCKFTRVIVSTPEITPHTVRSCRTLRFVVITHPAFPIPVKVTFILGHLVAGVKVGGDQIIDGVCVDTVSHNIASTLPPHLAQIIDILQDSTPAAVVGGVICT